MPRLVEPVSITEMTTRELEAIPRQTGEAARKKQPSPKIEHGGQRRAQQSHADERE
jgi:hypothetical protein